MNKLSQEDIYSLNLGKAKIVKASQDTDNAKLEFENLLLKIFFKYNISPNTHDILGDGTIVEKPKEEPKEEIKND
jgi:hypothetical protein